MEQAGFEEALGGGGELVPVLIEAQNSEQLEQALQELAQHETAERMSPGILSATLGSETLRSLIEGEIPGLMVSGKKRSRLHLDQASLDCGVTSTPAGPRVVAETGKGVFVAVVDSGFDLRHPMFLDGNGKLRVERLLVQRSSPAQADREFTTAQLESALAGGQNPAEDEDGHGTHVASIVGGSAFNGFQGLAPEARFLLVKTNFIDTDQAVKWAFDSARSKPCAVNLSLGHHFGAHDGTDTEERLFASLAGPGKIIVASAGNERNDALHIGGRFVPGQKETVAFDIFPGEQGQRPSAVITLWTAASDRFTFAVISPAGQQFAVPARNQGKEFTAAGATVQLARAPYVASNLTQVQIEIRFNTATASRNRLTGWQLRCGCETAVIGRLDGWFSNSGFGAFRSHPLVETARTIGMPATSAGCIAVASHISRLSWNSDNGRQTDSRRLVGASSDFSSLGPTRDGRQKPEISAPGQYVTAALAAGSRLEQEDDRSLDRRKLLTIEGTSMSAPMVTGAVALMLQKKPRLTPAQVTAILQASARRDLHTGAAPWTPMFGAGKMNVAEALRQT